MQKLGLLHDGRHLVAFSSDEAVAIRDALQTLDDVLTFHTGVPAESFHVEPAQEEKSDPLPAAGGQPPTPPPPQRKRPAVAKKAAHVTDGKMSIKPTLVEILSCGKDMTVPEIYAEFLRLQGMEHDQGLRKRVGVAIATYPETFVRVGKGVYRMPGPAAAPTAPTAPARSGVRSGESREAKLAARKELMKWVNAKLDEE